MENSPLLDVLKGKVKLIWNGWATGLSLFAKNGPHFDLAFDRMFPLFGGESQGIGTGRGVSLTTFEILKSLLDEDGQIVTSAKDFLSLNKECAAVKTCLGVDEIEWAERDIFYCVLNAGGDDLMEECSWRKVPDSFLRNVTEMKSKEIFDFCFLSHPNANPKISKMEDAKERVFENLYNKTMRIYDNKYSSEQDDQRQDGRQLDERVKNFRQDAQEIRDNLYRTLHSKNPPINACVNAYEKLYVKEQELISSKIFNKSETLSAEMIGRSFFNDYLAVILPPRYVRLKFNSSRKNNSRTGKVIYEPKKNVISLTSVMEKR